MTMSSKQWKPVVRLIVLAAAILFLAISEAVVLLVSLGGIQTRPYISSAVVAMHRYQLNPNAETELAWCKAREHLSEVERGTERIFTGFLVLNTVALVLCFQWFWRTKYRMPGAPGSPVVER